MSSSSVYYKFKSQREPSRVTFDGTAISVWDLKREIIIQNKMGKGTDFDLAIYDPDTEDGEQEIDTDEATSMDQHDGPTNPTSLPQNIEMTTTPSVGRLPSLSDVYLRQSLVEVQLSYMSPIYKARLESHLDSLARKAELLGAGMIATKAHPIGGP